MTSHSPDLSGFHTLLKSDGVWILFEKPPTLLDIAQARQLLGNLTDQIIKDQLNDVSIPIE